jgi:hypothetical protein
MLQLKYYKSSIRILVACIFSQWIEQQQKISWQFNKETLHPRQCALDSGCLGRKRRKQAGCKNPCTSRIGEYPFLKPKVSDFSQIQDLVSFP